MSRSPIVIELAEIGSHGSNLNEEDVRWAISLARKMFREACKGDAYSRRNIDAVLTKFTDAGRRSGPWKPTSSKVPGRPQDGADGNRIKRWLLDPQHKFYATEIDATLVEIKYIFQALSMTDAPMVKGNSNLLSWTWLYPTPAQPNTFIDPIRLTPVLFQEFIRDRRMITSGHIDPLDRSGKHEPSNTSLMLKSSNDLQGNLRIDELLNEMWEILNRHREVGGWAPPD